jgi:hypothetical protein
VGGECSCEMPDSGTGRQIGEVNRNRIRYLSFRWPKGVCVSRREMTMGFVGGENGMPGKLKSPGGGGEIMF